MRISLGVLIGIALIMYWWMKDHPQPQLVKQGAISTFFSDAGNQQAG